MSTQLGSASRRRRRRRLSPLVGSGCSKPEIRRCGRLDALFAFHVCDWLTPTDDLLNDRGLMGEGCIPIRQIRGWVEAAGFNGFNEVEIFSNRYWARTTASSCSKIKSAPTSSTHGSEDAKHS